MNTKPSWIHDATGAPQRVSSGNRKDQETIAFARQEGCFYNHHAPPFDLLSHTTSIQESCFISNAKTLVDQPGLIGKPLPQPPVPTETLEDTDDDPGDARVLGMLDFQAPLDVRTVAKAKILESIDLGSYHRLDLEEYTLELDRLRQYDYSDSWLPLLSTKADLHGGLGLPQPPKKDRLDVDTRVRRERLTLPPQAATLEKEVIQLTDRPFCST